MTLNENHDAEFIAKMMNERDLVLAESATLGGSEKSFRTRERREQRGHATQECRAGDHAPTDEARTSGEQESGREQVCLEQVCQTKSTLVDLQKQIADLTAENARLTVCAES